MITAYPEFRKIYEEAYTICLNIHAFVINIICRQSRLPAICNAGIDEKAVYLDGIYGIKLSDVEDVGD